MVIAVLEMMLPRGNEAVTIGALRAFWDTTCARPGCVGGGVFQEVGHPETALYIEMWQEAPQLEVHIRSQRYQQLLALMDTAAACRRCGSTSSLRHAGSRGWSSSASGPRAA